jgi:hypothetical protein
MPMRDNAAHALSDAGGLVLRGATRTIATARAAAKPLHPRGRVTSGSLRRRPAASPTGSRWLDEPGEDAVLVRESRAVGVPAGFPDIFGLAIRVPTGADRHGDLLFATTGLGRLTRYTLTAGRSPYARPMTTLLPYRTDAGPILLAARYREEWHVDLLWALRSRPWQPFAELRLEPEPVDLDADVSFDPVRNTLPGLENYDWVRRLRQPSYVTARRSRGSEAP